MHAFARQTFISFLGATFRLSMILSVTEGRFVRATTNIGLTYAGGPVSAGLAWGRGGVAVGTDVSQVSLFGAYNFGVAKVSLGMNTYDDGTAAGLGDGKGYLLGLTAPLGSGVAKFGYARSEVNGVRNHSKFGLGYQYKLSKRTSLEFNYGKDGENAIATAARAAAAPAALNQSGYEFVLTHNF